MAVLTSLFRLGRDAELRYTPDGTAVANLALAYNYGRKENGSQPSQWVDAAIFGKRAEALAEYLTKGIGIVATIEDVHVKTFEKRDGTQGASLAGRVLTLEFASKPAQQQQPTRPAPQKPAPKPASTEAPFEDDDIPF